MCIKFYPILIHHLYVCSPLDDLFNFSFTFVNIFVCSEKTSLNCKIIVHLSDINTSPNISKLSIYSESSYIYNYLCPLLSRVSETQY